MTTLMVDVCLTWSWPSPGLVAGRSREWAHLLTPQFSVALQASGWLTGVPGC